MFGMIQPVELSAKEKEALSDKIAAATTILREKAEQRYGEPKVKQLRYEYVKHVRGKHLFRFDTETRANLDILIGVEGLVLSAYIRMAMQLASSFYVSNRGGRRHLDENDYFQEAAWALFDAIYYYDASTQFSTYAYWSVKRRLAGFVRDEEAHAGIGRDVKQLRRRVREVIRERGCRIEEALFILRQSEKITPEMEADVRAAMSTVNYMEKDTRPAPNDETKPEFDELQALHAAVKLADLTPIQRELIEGYLRTGERIDADLVANNINPHTGRKYTRQALSQQWIRACDKLKAVMEEPVAA